MPTLTDKAHRHVVIDKREGEYLCFPDVVRPDDGTLIVAYNEQDKHIQPERRVPLVRLSKDNGKTWGDIIRLDVEQSHCPRLIKLSGNEIILADHARMFHRSLDNGATWESFLAEGLGHDMIDRPIALGNGVFLTTGHNHVGKAYAAIRQANTEQMVYRSDDNCSSWQRLGPVAVERNLVLCEGSMVQLDDGRIIALMRENSFVYDSMYLCISGDFGATWSRPVATPLIGHRPTLGLLDDGRLLVTYRNVAPDPGTVAWTGTLDELMSGYRVHGLHVATDNPALTSEGLRVRNQAGDESIVRYTLRPMVDPRTATATLEAEVRVDAAEKNGCGLRLGVWWKIYSDHIIPEALLEDEESGEIKPTPLAPISIESERFNTIRIEYAQGVATLFVNGERRFSLEVEADQWATRPVLLGAPFPFEENAVDCTWKRVHQTVDEPAMGTVYDWEWTPEDGFPDQWAQDSILELKNERHAAAPDFGYTGWTVMEDGSIFCAHHYGGGTEEGYEPLHTAHVMGTWFSLDDFRKD